LSYNRAALDEGAESLLAHETLGANDLPKVRPPVSIAATEGGTA
jgi:hypothetical protein